MQAKRSQPYGMALPIQFSMGTAYRHNGFKRYEVIIHILDTLYKICGFKTHPDEALTGLQSSG